MRRTKAKSISIIFLVLILLISMSVFIKATPIIEDATDIVFQDENLFNSIKLYFEAEKLKYIAAEPTLTLTVSEAELQGIERLNLKGTDGEKISNISGIENFENVKVINFADNDITDITPLNNLTKLVSIDLSNNANVNIYDRETKNCYLPNQSNLQQLYISSTKNSDISFVSELYNLEVLDISNNGISVLTGLKNLKKIQSLNVSNNTGITSIDDILNLHTLRELNISTTGITSLLHSDYREEEFERGIFELTKLEDLNVENNTLSIEPIYKTETNEETSEEKVYLSKLKKLNFNYTEQNDVDYNSLSLLSELTHLYMKGNGIENIDESITLLKNLQHINLAENEIEDISGFIKYDDDEKIESTIAAKQIDLKDNHIQDIRPIAEINHDITYLNLASNKVFFALDILDYSGFSFSEGLDLTRQGRDKFDENGNEEKWGMEIKIKTAEINHYIILPELFQNSKDANSRLYSSNTTFDYEGIELNPDTKYHIAGEYNIIIKPEKSEENDNEENEEYEEENQRDLSITLNGGIGDESKLYFHLIEDDNSTDSILVKDVNLARAIEEELKSQIPTDNPDDYYIVVAKDIINVTSSLITGINTLRLEEKNISDLSGLESFENLEYLYISNNTIASIEPLQYCQNMKELYVSNNPNIGNNNSAIQRMEQLTKLDLSNTGLTNLQSLEDLIERWNENESCTLEELNISGNSIQNIECIGNIKTLNKLNVSDIGVEDISQLQTLTELKTLNASNNKIENIEPLRKLTQLKYLYLSNNKIVDISPISKISLDTLEFSNNRVKDVSMLTKVYTTIKMDTNQISDTSNFNGKPIQTFSAKNQKITKTIESGESAETIPLPKIFLDAKDSQSKVYSSKAYITTDCNISADGNSVIINSQGLGNNIATVKINGGNADNTTFFIAKPLNGIISYEPSNEIKTNKDVTATITFNRSNVTILNNEGKNTYTFTENGEFEFLYADESGFEGTTKAIVNNIDKTAPTITGVENGMKYKTPVTPIVEDENLKDITLFKNNVKVEGYQSGTKIQEEGQYSLTATDIVENSTTIYFEIERIISDVITSDSLTVTEENQIISGIKSGMSVQDLKNALQSEMEYEVVDKNGETISNSTKIATGYQIKMDNGKTYTLSVLGDATGDGKVDFKDMVTINRHRLNKKKLEKEFLIAGDVNGDNKVDFKDLVKINRFRLNKITEL